MSTAKVFVDAELDNGKIVRYQVLPTIFKNYVGETYIVSFNSSCFRAYKPSWLIDYKKQFGDTGSGFVRVDQFIKLILIQNRKVNSVKSLTKINPDGTVMRCVV
ncbi:MAG TPA: hypothetical protein VLE02_01605 [Nitrosarchaeum sp.]|nr:hypothetical protein [Nitrosarchaeum sp.]